MKDRYFYIIGLLWICMIVSMIFYVFSIKQIYTEQTISFLGAVNETYEINQNTVDEFLKNRADHDLYEKGLNLLNDSGYEKSGLIIIGSALDCISIIFMLIISLIFVLLLITYIRSVNRFGGFLREVSVWIDDLQNNTKKSRISRYEEKYYVPLLDAVGRYAQNTSHMMTTMEKEKERLYNFMEDVYHQLKTPLSIIRLYTEKTAESKHSLVQIDKMTKLINDLLTIGRFDAGKIKMKIVPNNMSEFTEIVINDLYPLPENKNIQIHVEGDEKDNDWRFDTFWLKEAVLNILKNAIEHSPEHENIHLQYKKETNEYMIHITDRGTGIHSQDIDTIFDRFSGTYKNGTGLGLYIAKQILKNHFGDITAAQNTDRGAVFTLRFPILKESTFYGKNRICHTDVRYLCYNPVYNLKRTKGSYENT